MAGAAKRSRVSAGVPSGGEFATEVRGENDDLVGNPSEIVQLTPDSWALGTDTVIRLEPNTSAPPEDFWEDNAAHLEAIRDAGLRGPLTLRHDIGLWVLRARLPHSGKDFGVILSSPAYKADIEQNIARIDLQVASAVFEDLVGDDKRIRAIKLDDGSYRVYDLKRTRVKVHEPRMGDYYVPASAGIDYRDGQFGPMTNGESRITTPGEDANWQRLSEALGVKGRAQVEAKIRSAIASIDTHPDVVWLNDGKQ